MKTVEKSVCIIDYGVGNVRSVQNALSYLKIKSVISDSKKIIEKSDYLILPGVGSFEAGMKGLKDHDLIETLRQEVMVNNKKILGICLGMQLFATKGYEYGEFPGLDFIKGKVVKIDNKESKLRLPHIGWNNVAVGEDHAITKGFEKEPVFYFVHSFHFVPDDSRTIAGTCEYGHKIVAIIESENIFGVQFHPEKSHSDGVKIFNNFLDIQTQQHEEI